MLQKREHHTRIGNPILGTRATTLRSARCNTVTTDNREMRCLHAAPTYGPTSRARYPFIFSFHFYSFTFHNNKCYYFLAYLFFSFPGFSFYLLSGITLRDTLIGVLRPLLKAQTPVKATRPTASFQSGRKERTQ